MATADIAATPLTDIEHRGQLRRAVIASTLGTTIEWYLERRSRTDWIWRCGWRQNPRMSARPPPRPIG